MALSLSPSFIVLLALFAFCVSSVLSAAVTTPLLPLTERGQRVYDNNDNIGCGGQVGCSSRGRSCFGPTCVATGFCNVSGICSNRRSNDRSCSNDYECKNSFCVGGVCKDRQYFKIGQACGIEGQCDFQGYCSCSADSCVCKAKPSIGQACDSTTGCSADTVCQTTTNVCVEMFSVASGSACSSTVECQPGLYCGGGQCKDPGTPSFASCSKTLPSGALERDSSLCSSSEVCNCKDFLDGTPFQCVAPQTYTKSEANKLKAVHKCAQKKKCKDLTYYQDGDLKICGACEAKYCSAIKGYYETYEDWRTCVNPYREMFLLCDYSLAPWISVVIGICLGVVIIVLCMSVFLCGNK